MLYGILSVKPNDVFYAQGGIRKKKTNSVFNSFIVGKRENKENKKTNQEKGTLSESQTYWSTVLF